MRVAIHHVPNIGMDRSSTHTHEYLVWSYFGYVDFGQPEIVNGSVFILDYGPNLIPSSLAAGCCYAWADCCPWPDIAHGLKAHAQMTGAPDRFYAMQQSCERKDSSCDL